MSMLTTAAPADHGADGPIVGAFQTSFVLAVSREARDALLSAVRTFAAIPESVLAARLAMPPGTYPTRWRGSLNMLATKVDRVSYTPARRDGTWHVAVSAVQGERFAHALRVALATWSLPAMAAGLLRDAEETDARAALDRLGRTAGDVSAAWAAVLDALDRASTATDEVVVPLTLGARPAASPELGLGLDDAHDGTCDAGSAEAGPLRTAGAPRAVQQDLFADLGGPVRGDG